VVEQKKWLTFQLKLTQNFLFQLVWTFWKGFFLRHATFLFFRGIIPRFMNNN